MSRLKGLRHIDGPGTEWINARFKLEKKEKKDLELVATRFPPARTGKPAIGKAVASLIRSALFCFRHHTDVYHEPRQWSEEEAEEAGLHIPGRIKAFPINMRAGPRRTKPEEDSSDALD